jgi:predicted YcjX-like family ATPase
MFSSADCRSISSTIPANGCSICRCSAKSFADFQHEAFEMAVLPVREDLVAEPGGRCRPEIDPNADADEMTARRLAESFAAYLKACKLDERALSTLPPGRFLMPGDLEGSPALTFAPLAGIGDRSVRARGSLHAMMDRRYEAYKTHVVKPFFREHITRLDRQIVLIDAMQALNRRPRRHGRSGTRGDRDPQLFPSRPGQLPSPTCSARRIDRILVAATKADHLHHESHDRLQAIVRRLADRAVARANFTGADVDVVAMAAVRATREGTVKQGRETLPVIIGTPIAGEKINGETFDGKTETAIFPGDLAGRS